MKRHIPARFWAQPWIIMGVLGLGSLLYIFVYFSTGQRYTEDPGKQFIGSNEKFVYNPTAQVSPECLAKRQKEKELIGPLQKRYDKLSKIIVYSPLPVENGVQMHEESEKIADKISGIQTQYHCE